MARFKKKRDIKYELFHGPVGNTWCIINGILFVPLGNGCGVFASDHSRFISGTWYPDGKELVDFLK